MVYSAQGSRVRALRLLQQAVKLDDTFEGVKDAKRQIKLIE